MARVSWGFPRAGDLVEGKGGELLARRTSGHRSTPLSCLPEEDDREGFGTDYRLKRWRWLQASFSLSCFFRSSSLLLFSYNFLLRRTMEWFGRICK
jgi:hypothetical protein